MNNQAAHKRYRLTCIEPDGSRYHFCPAQGCWVTGSTELMTGPDVDAVLARMLAKGGDSQYTITDEIVAAEIMRVRQAAEARVLEFHGYDDLPYEVRKNAAHIRLEARAAGDAAVKAAGYQIG